MQPMEVQETWSSRFVFIMAAVGIVSAAGMYVYGRWTYRLKEA